MKQFIKSVILSMILLLVFTLPALSAETTAKVTEPASSSQYVDNLRSLKVVAQQGSEIPINGRILDLIIELDIHKLKLESADTFKKMVKETMFPDDADLNGGKFQVIAKEVLLGTIDDDTALTQLQEPETIESAIKGKFTGWSGRTIFQLQNGQLWQQSTNDYIYCYTENPKITIYKYWYSPSYKMKVDGVKKEIDVIRIK